MMTMSKAMKVPVSMRWRTWIIVMLMPWFVGCSAVRLSYNNGATISYFWLDGYANFTSEQAPRAKAALADWFGWHRATQLGDYAAALADLGAMAAKPVTAAAACSTYDAWLQRFATAYERAVPALAEQARSLSPAQITHLEAKLAERLADQRSEHLAADPAERQRRSLARTVDRAETLYGPLDEAQRQLLAKGLQASPFDAERWLAERARRNDDIVRSLRQWQAERADAATVQAGLRRLGAELLQSPRADYQTYQLKVVQANCALVARLQASTMPAQRQRAADKLKGWEDDLRALAAQR